MPVLFPKVNIFSFLGNRITNTRPHADIRQNHCHKSVQPRLQLLKTLQRALQILDDIHRQFIRRRKVVEVGKGFVFNPENVKTGFVSRQYVLDIKPTETPVRIVF